MGKILRRREIDELFDVLGEKLNKKVLIQYNTHQQKTYEETTGYTYDDKGNIKKTEADTKISSGGKLSTDTNKETFYE